MGAVDLPPSLTRLLSETYCLASCVGYTDGPAVFIAAGDFPIGAETPLLTWLSAATGIPLDTLHIWSMRTKLDHGRLRVSRVAGLHN